MVIPTVRYAFTLLITLSATAVPAATPAGYEGPPVVMDSRFSGFDAIAYIRRNHGSLAQQAEIISHWAGYYSLNPILLAHVVKARSSQDVINADSIKSLARTLGSLTAVPREATRRERISPQDLHDELRSMFSLSGEMASKVIDLTRQETEAAGLSAILAVTSDTPPALDLPFARPQAWQFNGVHTWTGDDDGTPMSSLDFVRSWSLDWGDNTSTDWISSAHDGEVTVHSSCFVDVLHNSGWSTRYYHLDDLQVENGQRLQAGDRLGNYANDESQALCSGGHSTGPHLHFALRKDGQYFSLQDMALSGYIIHPGDSSYDTARDRMWLEKRGERFYAFDETIAQQAGDNTIDYRYNGVWFSADHNGHGLNVEVTEFPGEEDSRKSVFIVMYTYDDDGLANFYAGNRDYDRWRSDESLVVDMLQTSGGDFSNLFSVDFNDPESVEMAGEAELLFIDCGNAQIDLSLKERSSGQTVNHSIDLTKLIGVPDHVCAAASLPLPESAN